MSLNFNNCLVKINGTGLWCQSASLSSSNSSELLGAIGYVGAVGNTTNGGINSNIDISYYLKPSFEPNINYIKAFEGYTGIKESSAFVLSVGGITGSYHLKNLSLSVGLNNLVNVNAGYSCYHHLSGNLQPETLASTPTVADYAHALTTYPIPDIGTLFNLNCNFNIELQPIFEIGKKEPSVYVGGIQQDTSITRDVYTGVSFDAERIDDVIGTQFINFAPMSFLGTSNFTPFDGFHLGVSGSKIVSTSFSAQNDDIVRVSTELRKLI